MKEYEKQPHRGGPCGVFDLPVVMYRDRQGMPTCAASFPEHLCRFYASRKFGTQELCTVGREEVQLNRRGKQIGTLIPHPECPLWKGVAR